MGCVFPMVVVSIQPHAEFGQNDHREDALYFTNVVFVTILVNHFGAVSF